MGGNKLEIHYMNTLYACIRSACNTGAYAMGILDGKMFNVKKNKSVEHW